MSEQSSKQGCRIAVIGSGPAGIAMARELLLQGFEQVTVLEKNAAAGGTWHQHSYPGLACDVWAHSYSYSFAPNPDWSANFVERDEIEAYLQRCAREFGVEQITRFNTSVTGAAYLGDGRWELTLNDSDKEIFDVVINAGGNQHTPQMPNIPGIDNFSGPSWHSTNWNHEVDLRGKRVALIGSAAAAVQIVPELISSVEHLTVIQRRPNWIMERGRKPYSGFQKRLFALFPPSLKLLRKIQGFFMGLVYQAATMGHKRMQDFENMALKHLDSKVTDPKLRDALVPSSHYGCQRGLVSDGYYDALQANNCELVTDAAAEITSTGVTTESGRHIEADAIVYCTGYKVMDFDRFEVLGENNQSLMATMAQAPEAFKGMAVPGFPNYFYVIGPNGLLLSASYFVTAEICAEALARLLSDKADKKVKTLSVKPELHKQFSEWVADNVSNFSWGHSSCNSYYRSESGHAPFLYPGSIKQFKQMKAECGLHEYKLE
ncbi:MAG: flavin-containing monooxygenase [Pseudomonadales bacterium]